MGTSNIKISFAVKTLQIHNKTCIMGHAVFAPNVLSLISASHKPVSKHSIQLSVNVLSFSSFTAY